MAHATRPRTLDPDKLGPLQDWLAAALGAKSITIAKTELLSGGAIGENWRIELHVKDGPHEGAHNWVLRTDAASRMAMSHDRANEFACLKSVHDAGVLVPEPITECHDAALIGAPFMVVGLLRGNAQSRKLVRDPDIAQFGEALGIRLGSELAKIHSILPPVQGLDFMEIPDASPARIQVAQMRANADTLCTPRPALEYILTWLDENAPPKKPVVLCHGDFRTGNYMVDAGKLTGILDWEFCHWGDPHLDVGWFCARCWRFGADAREAGGIASREAFYRGYNAKAETKLDDCQVHNNLKTGPRLSPG